MDIKCAHTAVVDLMGLIPNPKNPNKHPKAQIDMLSKIISYQGQRLPIVVSKRSGFIVKGHGRLEAIHRLGWTKAAVDYQDYDDEAQEFADMIADNKIAELAQHDDEMFKLEAINLDLDKNGFDLDLLGIPDLDLSIFTEKGNEDEIPEVTQSISKLGDIYQLGNHRLMCGDSTDKATVEKLMNGVKADMVFTDPPYGININAAYGDRMQGKGELAGRSKKIYSNIIGDDEEFDPSFILQQFGDAKIFFWGANNYTKNLPRGSWLVWYKKTTEGLSKMFGWSFELCWTNQAAGQVYEQAWAGCFGHNKKLDGDTKTHPSMKSVALIDKIFADHSAAKVVDLFGGSGSTLIACEKTNRKCFMMELDPHYVDVIVSRFCRYVNNTSINRNGENIEWPMK